MAIETINNGETGAAIRAKLNGNFGKALNLDPIAGLLLGGAAPNAEQRAAVRAGMELDGQATTYAPRESYDVVVYGATPNGIMAAVAAAKGGARVCVIEPSMHVGGEITSGISKTDYRANTHYRTAMNANTANFFREAARKVGQEAFDASYADQWNYPCQVFSSVITDVLRDNGISVHLDWRLKETTGVTVASEEIVSCTFEQGAVEATVKARVWINAFQFPDLGRQAGISYINGREASSVNEATAGTTAANLSFTGIDPYITPGDAGSGLLPGVADAALPAVGTASTSGMWDCFRLTVTNDPAQRVAFQAPTNYDATRYELLGRWMASGGSSPTTLSALLTRYDIREDAYPDGIAEGKLIQNWNNTNISLNMVGGQPDYWTSTYAQREDYDQVLRDYTLGLIHWLNTDSRVPSAIKTELADWGLLAGEPYGDNGLPPQAYRREPGRMVGRYVMDYRDAMGTRVSGDPVAFGCYNGDVHFCGAWLDSGAIKIEGLTSYTPPNRYPIDRGAVLPPVGKPRNFLEAHCVSSTHLAWGSVRVAPTLMSVGEACGAMAALAVSRNTDVASITGADIRDVVGIADMPAKGLLAITGTTNINEVGGPTTQTQTYGTIAITGRWDYEAAPIGFIGGSGNFHDRGGGKGLKTLVFTPDISTLGGAGMYRIVVNAPAKRSVDLPDCNAIPVSVLANGVTYTEKVDGLCGEWVARTLGVYRFAGTGTETVTVSNTGTDGTRLRFNSMRFERIGD